MKKSLVDRILHRGAWIAMILYLIQLTACETDYTSIAYASEIVGLTSTPAALPFTCTHLGSSGPNREAYDNVGNGQAYPQLQGGITLESVGGTGVKYVYGMNGMRAALNAQVARELAAGLPARTSANGLTIRCSAPVPVANWRMYYTNMTIDAMIDLPYPGGTEYTLRINLNYTYGGEIAGSRWLDKPFHLP